MPKICQESGWEFHADSNHGELIDLMVKEGYDCLKFYYDNVLPSSPPSLDCSSQYLLSGSTPYVVSIKHVESGVTLTFDALDVIYNFYRDRQCSETESDVRDYLAKRREYTVKLGKMNLFLTSDIDLDYKGTINIPAEISCPETLWTAVDPKTVREQIAWTSKLEVCGHPVLFEYYPDKTKKKKRGGRGDRMNSAIPLINSSVPIFDFVFLPPSGKVDNPFGENNPLDNKFNKNRYRCYFHLVVTRHGWIFHICHRLRKCDGSIHYSQTTMHCQFEQNIVYREITKIHSLPPHKGLDGNEKEDDEMYGLFHQVTQLKLLGFDAQRDPLFGFKTSENRYVEGPKLTAAMIGCLLAEDGKIVKEIEAETGTSILVVPLFGHSYSEDVSGCPIGRLLRRAYIHGQKDNIECAKRLLCQVLEQIEERTGDKVISHGEVLSDEVLDVGNIFLEE